MTRLREFQVATLTYDQSFAGTNSLPTIIINQQGFERIHQRMTDDNRLSGSFKREKAALFTQQLPIGGQHLEHNFFNPSSIRVATRSNDQWRPQHVFVWGKTVADVTIPLAIETNMNVELSSEVDSSGNPEGVVSAPIRSVQRGGPNVTIRRLQLVVSTRSNANAWTDDPLYVQVEIPGTLLVNHTVPTTAADLDNGTANMFMVPVASPFTKSMLQANGHL